MKLRLCLILLFPFALFAQPAPKRLTAEKVFNTIKVDGRLDDVLWEEAPVATDFVMFDPGIGLPIPQRFRTQVKVLYSDEAILVGAFMHDQAPDSILTQMTARDNFNENCDWFGIFINPFNDGLSDFNFWVTAAGVQADSRTTANGDDFSWNTVWESAVRITDSGWVCEIRIPYISLRFPKTQKKDWGLNMIRNIRRNRQQYSWNLLDRNSGFSLEYQTGLLAGMEEINPPVRLSLMPYLSTYANAFDGETNYDFNAGLDLKYGINESFTLDMTLIPDFGQVPFDRQVLNLSPFENQFDENRQFFTEGAELFTIGDLFYSRRIGGAPKNITGQALNNGESVDIRQEFTRLLNATKISGRSNGNLGIGFLNAVTADNYTVFTDSSGNETRVLTEPLTNYNVLVLDQRFNRNSSVSFINTNVLRNGTAPDANVMGLVSSLYSKSGNYLIEAQGKRSDQITEQENIEGYESMLSLSDVGGNWRWSASQTLRTDQYEINDLGFLQRNNQIAYNAAFSRETFQPIGAFNRTRLQLVSNHRSLYRPNRFESFDLGFESFFLLRSFFAFGVNTYVRPVEAYDYFEPRNEDYFFKLPGAYSMDGFISSDYRKPVALDLRVAMDHWFGMGRAEYSVNIEPRLRFSDRLFSILTFDVLNVQNDYGWVAENEGQPYFGKRDIYQLTSSVNATYTFTPQMSLGLNLRHLWTGVDYLSFFALSRDGELEPTPSLAGVNDINFNTFNLDLRFSWWFAPGSEMILLYRNAIAGSGSTVNTDYFTNLRNTWSAPQQNNLSLRLTYFLDYNTLRKKF